MRKHLPLHRNGCEFISSHRMGSPLDSRVTAPLGLSPGSKGLSELGGSREPRPTDSPRKRACNRTWDSGCAPH